EGCSYVPGVARWAPVPDRWDGDGQGVARCGVGPATRGGASGPAAPSPGLRAGQAGGTVLRRVAPIPPGPRRRPTVGPDRHPRRDGDRGEGAVAGYAPRRARGADAAPRQLAVVRG